MAEATSPGSPHQFTLGGRVSEVHRLASAAEAETCATIMSTTEPWITLGRDHARCLTMLLDPQREAWVALPGPEVIGLLLLNLQGAFVGYVQSIAICEGRRSRGVGSHLLAFAEDRIFAEAPNVFLCVSAFNPRARALYQRLGFRLVDELPDYVVPGQSELLMRKTIGSLEEFRRKRAAAPSDQDGAARGRSPPLAGCGQMRSAALLAPRQAMPGGVLHIGGAARLTVWVVRGSCR